MTNDSEGDLATHIQILADTRNMGERIVSSGIGGLIIDTGKHVYSNWESIMEKRGHLNPLMDPFKFEANKKVVPDYKKDMCPKTLDLLSRAVNIPINPEHTKSDLDKIAETILNI